MKPRLPLQIVNEVLHDLYQARKNHPDWPEIALNGKSVQATAINTLIARWGGTPYKTVKGRLDIVRQMHPDLYEAAVAGQGGPPAAPEPIEVVQEPPRAATAPEVTPRTFQEDRELHQARSNAAYDRQRLKEAYQEIARLAEKMNLYEAVHEAPYAPAQWMLEPRRHAKSEHIPYLLTSDFQVSEVINPDETDHAHGYNVEIFRSRYRQLIETTVDLCFNHQAQWTFPGIVYARGGDTISGGIHEELADTDELTPIDSVIVAAEEEGAGIEKLAEAFGHVRVEECGGGNHDRDTKKPRSKGALSHSYDKLVSYILRKHFRNDPRVTFHGTTSPDVFFSVYDTNILLTHGDKIGSRGGQGFIGPAATVMRGAQKVIMEQQAIGRRVDEVHMGHFHVALDLGYVVVNGCLPGYSEYAKLNRLRPEAPCQLLRFYHPKHGCVDTKKVKLT